jgi:hypothetical protein
MHTLLAFSFVRFHQGQLVKARHHVHFYEARVLSIKQPSLKEIVRSLSDAYELAKITHPSSPTIDKMAFDSLSPEVRDALKNLMNATEVYVHYVGWNSRYDEWLPVHKIRVDEKVIRRTLWLNPSSFGTPSNP